MSSEEMRVELESFVNTGLREGWCGWPLKEGICMRRISSQPLRGMMARFWCKRNSGPTISGEWLRAARVVDHFCVEN
jgi:hypothetical protein